MEIQNFKSWNYLKQLRDNGDIDIYTKTELKRIGYKPRDDAKCVSYSVYTGSGWKPFDFYTIEDCVKVKKRTVNNKNLDTTLENICKSLYVINKSAKISRETKQEAYYDRKFQVVNSAKTRQNKLYDLKDAVIKKMIKENKLTLEGYHIQKIKCEELVYDYDYKTEEVNKIYEPCEKVNYLLMYQALDFTYHIPVNSLSKDVKFLGELDGKISNERNNVGIKFNEAVKLLEKYVEQ